MAKCKALTWSVVKGLKGYSSNKAKMCACAGGTTGRHFAAGTRAHRGDGRRWTWLDDLHPACEWSPWTERRGGFRSSCRWWRSAVEDHPSCETRRRVTDLVWRSAGTRPWSSGANPCQYQRYSDFHAVISYVTFLIAGWYCLLGGGWRN